ncbi:MAG: replication-relaxation family protein [Caldilineaceae bacterium]
MQAVLKHRLLSAEQIQRLCLPCQEGNSLRGRLEYTRQLLRVLTHHKYLVRRRLIGDETGQNPLVFASTWKGAQAVAAHLQCSPQEVGWDVHDKVITWANENLHHLVAENEVYIRLAHACENASVEIQAWQSDRALYRRHQGKKVSYTGPHGGMYHKVLIPDGYYELARQVSREGRTGTIVDRLLIEVDMGTQTLAQRQKTIKRPQRTWEHKVKAYQAFFQPGGVYEQLYGSSKGRVLTITPSERRLLDMKKVTEDVGGNERFWYCTFDEFVAKKIYTDRIYMVATKPGTYCLFGDALANSSN